MRRIVAVIALGAAAVGCSTIDPSPKLKAATSAIDAAKAAGAASVGGGASDLLAQAEKYLATAQSLIKSGDVEQGIRQLNLASAAADDARMAATEATNIAKSKELDVKIADLKSKLGK